MKRVVVSTDLHEADIRPSQLLDEFKKLSLEGASEYFGNPADLVEVPNPSGAGGECKVVFEKDGFQYKQAEACGSVFVSPRPTKEALEAYRQNSQASEYKAQRYAHDTAEARRAHLLRSHALWMGQLFDEIGNPEAKSYVDIGTNSPLIFEEVKSLNLFDKLYSLNPLPGLEDECRDRGAEIIEEPIRGVGAITAFEQFESQFSPLELAESARDMLAEGGMFFFTTRTMSGFDLQMLWDKTPYIFVPEHLNLLSLKGIETLVEYAGLDLVELSTPGQLDVELTRHALQNDRTISLPPFIQYLLEERDRIAHADFQEFLQKHRLSSHARVVAVHGKGVQK